MIIGWSWEWPAPACSPGRHEWALNSFVVTGYEAGVTRSYRWWRCRECYIRSETKP